MADIGTDITTSPPSVGAAGTGYATDINSILTEVITRLEAKVKVSSLDPANADLDMNANDVVNAKSVGLYPATSVPAGAPFGRLEYYNGEVYIVTPAGVVQVTSSGAVNTASTGSITGDFGSGPERVTFVNADERYDFWDDQAGGGYAIVRSRQFDYIDEATARIISLKAPTTVSGTYTLNLPVSNPASSKVLFTTSGGQMTYADSASGAVTQFSLNAQDLLHTDKVVWVPARGKGTFKTISGTAPTDTDYGQISCVSTGVFRITLDIPPVGKRIKSVTVKINKGSANTSILNWYILNTGAVSALKGTASNGSSGEQTLTATANHTVVTGDNAVIAEIDWVGNGTVRAFAVTYDYV